MNDNTGNSTPSLTIAGESVLPRLLDARGQASKDSNRLFLAALVLTGLYAIKASGLRVDIALLNKDLAKLPYGLFFFLIAAQLSALLCYMRSADAAVIHGRISRHVQMAAISSGAIASDLINEHEWFAASTRMFEEANPGKFASIVHSLISIPTALTAVILYLAPILAGIYALSDWKRQLSSGNIDLQYWTLAVTTVFAATWFINFCIIHNVAGERR